MASTDAPNADRPRRIALLGSTGSIGGNALQVIRHLGPAYRVEALAAGANVDALTRQARDFDVRHLALADGDGVQQLRHALPHATVHHGPEALVELIESVDVEVMVGAVVGAAGLPATLRAIERQTTIALANKETLVAAGELVVPLARRHGVDLLPIDSEHSAIFQCLCASHQATKSPNHQVKRIVLTASGGPFRSASADTIANATVEQALAHPTWNMGRKITIDSATMMNKALEIIEAHWLFGLSADQIDVIIHPQSIAHSFVEFADHSILAQMGTPDMRTPIQYALTWPDRPAGCSRPLDWSQLSRLDFEPPDQARFPALELAYRVIEAGGTSGAVLNAANEVAVDAFFDRRIRLGRIPELVGEALNAIPARPAERLDDVLAADAEARERVRRSI